MRKAGIKQWVKGETKEIADYITLGIDSYKERSQ
jgi:hypothetical protein